MKQDILTKKQIQTLDQYYIPDEIKKEAVLLSYQKGELLCKQDANFPYLLLVITGKVKVCITEANGKTLLLSFYYPGSILGDVELLLDSKGTTNVTAITLVDCIGIPMKACKQALTQNPVFLKYTSQTIATKLVKSSKHNATNMLYTLENRLCAYIEATNEDAYFEENLTQLSELLGSSYRHLLRCMDLLCKNQVLEKCSHNKYKILDFKQLRQKAKDCFLLY